MFWRYGRDVPTDLFLRHFCVHLAVCNLHHVVMVEHYVGKITRYNVLRNLDIAKILDPGRLIG
jgi:hypothetical protein